MKGSSLCNALYTYDVQKWPKLPMPANVYFNTYVTGEEKIVARPGLEPRASRYP